MPFVGLYDIFYRREPGRPAKFADDNGEVLLAFKQPIKQAREGEGVLDCQDWSLEFSGGRVVTVLSECFKQIALQDEAGDVVTIPNEVSWMPKCPGCARSANATVRQHHGTRR